MELFLAILIKPFVALVVFFFVYWIAHFIYKKMPDGRLKKILFSPLPGHKRGRWG